MAAARLFRRRPRSASAVGRCVCFEVVVVAEVVHHVELGTREASSEGL